MSASDDRADPHAPTVAGPLVSTSGSLDVSPTLMAGRYELSGLLGAGAMGTVYRAHDRELDEIVALKVVRKELAAAPGMLERFRREVKLARRVTHRNVARMFDIGEHAGDRFLTMEFVDGEPLGTWLARRGRASPSDALGIAHDLCAGLAAAHAANVLHRDLKPENVVVAKDGRAVITDFGIARALAQTELARTAQGIVGTPAYMAPEQVEGAADLDGRADLYALGALLYELLTGEPPWQGPSVIAVAAARLMRPPPNVRDTAPEVAEPIAALVLRLMARRREDRFQSAEEALEAIDALRRVTRPSAPPPSLVPSTRQVPSSGKTVAVLPFTNDGPDDDAYLAEGVTEDLVDLLSVVPELRVRPRGEAARFASRGRDVREAGRVLGVDVVVDGSLRRMGSAVRVSVRLVTVEDGFQLWARRFERPAPLVLAVADEAANAIADVLTTKLVTPARAHAPDEIAQDLYLRGRFLLHRAWFEATQEGARLLAEAHARAPSDARIAGTYALAMARQYSRDVPAGHMAERAREIAARALALDPTQPEAHVALGLVRLGDHDVPGAVDRLVAALDGAPNAVDALEALGRLLVEVGRPEQGCDLLSRALAIEPQLVEPRYAIARARALAGDYDGFTTTMGPPPSDPSDFAPWLLLRVRICIWRRDRAEVTELVSRVELPADLPPRARIAIAQVVEIGRTGTLDDALFAQVRAGLPIDDMHTRRRASFNAQLIAEVTASAGRIEDAMHALRRCDALGLVDIVWLDRCEGLAPVRTHPDFAAIRAATATRAEEVLAAIDARFSGVSGTRRRAT